MVQTSNLTAQSQASPDIVLTPGSVSETAFENDPAAILSVQGGGNGSWEYEILDDSSGGAFRIEGDRLIVADNARLDFETAPEVTLTIRATDSSGQSVSETMTVAVTDEAIERRYSTGGKFVASETEAGWAGGRDVVALAGGGFALIWTHYSDTTFSDGKVVVRYFDSSGTPASDEIIILSGTFLRDLSTTPTAEGGFLLTRTTAPDPATGISRIETRGFDDSGHSVGPVIVWTPAGGPEHPVAIQLGNGGYVLSWTGPGEEIHAQRFNSAGAPAGPDILVGTGFGSEPHGLTATADGGFAVAWVQHSDGGTGPQQVMARFFDSSGAPSGPPVAVESEGFLTETPTLVALADGSYVLGWAEFAGSAGGSGFVLKALPIGADGLAGGEPVTLATYKSESQFGPQPSFVAHPDGGFVAMWPGQEPAPNDTVTYRFTGRQFDSSGAPIGPEFHPTQSADGAGVAVLADGTIATVWYGQDSDGLGVFARVYRPADEPAGTSGNDVLYGDAGADWLDGLAGDDTLYGLGGDDVLLGRSGDDILRGGAGDDVLRGGRGNDFLYGGSGADTMRGGAGNDYYVVDNEGDTVIEAVDAGWDEIHTALATFSIEALPNIEGLTAATNGAHDLRGNSGDNFIAGDGGNDVLRLQDGGDDTVYGGAGSDNIFIIGALTSADIINGGEGIDTLVIQGPYGSLVLTANITEIENISILAGSNTAFGEPGTNRYDYVLTVTDANFAAGVQARINGAALLAGEDFTFNGSAETDASFVVYGGKGKDTLTGGLGNDIFFYAEERFASGDTVNGGPGYDGMFLRGNYTIDFNAPGYTGLFTNIENLTLTSATDERYARGGGTEFDYNLTLSNAIVKAGETLTISGSLLMASETMILDASKESDGFLRLFGGKANDTLKGGGQADLIHGNLGADMLTGNGGADVFRYDSTAESNSASRDRILDFKPGTDKIDLSRIDANTLVAGDQAFAWIGGSAFSGSAGQLRAYQSGGSWFVEGDTNGDGAADLVIALTLQGTAPIGPGDFVL
jgi:Ca2+-binding RTX toxin-like protein